MADVTITVNKITALNTVTAVTASPATETNADTAQIFNITPTRPRQQGVLTVSVANSHGAVALSVAAGGMCNAPSAALSLSVAQNTTKAIQLDPTKYLSAAGVYTITATPASGKILATNHALTFTYIENLP